ncbi:MAG: hypothetical protein M3137_19815 [Actinomycetota bacterium]|nr:hypothetical protein [Actinomycetota bacterium]
MEDNEVIGAFLDGVGTGDVFGPSLHVEDDSLKLDGWWYLAYRVSGHTVLVRDEEPPTASSVPEDMATQLKARGLAAVGADLPAITLLTYTALDLGYAPWVLWSIDLPTGEADLHARATEESSLQQGPTVAMTADYRNWADSVYVRGARRTAGAPTHVVITVGVTEDRSRQLGEQLEDCRIERRSFGEIDPADCGSLFPTMVIVDATASVGSSFVADLHAHRSFVGPLVAITDGGEMHAGADATVAAADEPDRWLPLIRALIG